MTVYSVRYIFGVTILLTHFLSIVLYVVFGLKYQSNFSDVMAGVAILTPLTATYGLTFVRYVVANRVVSEKERKEPFNMAPFLVQFFIILLFSVSLIALPSYLFYQELLVGGHENIKLVVGGLETVFAAYLSLIFSSLFPMAWEKN